MSSLRKRRNRQQADVDVDMVPIMNMFLVLVPFLLMSASFLHIKAINTSVPVLGDAATEITQTEKTIKTTVVAEIKGNGIALTVNADALEQNEINQWSEIIPMSESKEYLFADLKAYLMRLKKTYPASDTIIIIPDSEVLYDTIIHTMDVARYSNEKMKLFPNVVISGKIT
jgi:biopolymer transport protein ExbD